MMGGEGKFRRSALDIQLLPARSAFAYSRRHRRATGCNPHRRCTRHRRVPRQLVGRIHHLEVAGLEFSRLHSDTLIPT